MTRNSIVPGPHDPPLQTSKPSVGAGHTSSLQVLKRLYIGRQADGRHYMAIIGGALVGGFVGYLVASGFSSYLWLQAIVALVGAVIVAVTALGLVGSNQA